VNESRIRDCAGAICMAMERKPEGYIQFCRDNAQSILDELSFKIDLLDAIKGLRRGDCFCEAGIDNPMMGGRHSEACLKAQAAIAQAEGRH
jgi:hypothetical protein